MIAQATTTSLTTESIRYPLCEADLGWIDAPHVKRSCARQSSDHRLASSLWHPHGAPSPPGDCPPTPKQSKSVTTIRIE